MKKPYCGHRSEDGQCMKPAVQRLVMGRPARLIVFRCEAHKMTAREAKKAHVEVFAINGN